MLQSIIVYSLMGFSLFGLGQVAAKREQIYIAKNKNLPFFTWEILFSLLIFAFFSGIRWNVGVDHLSYLSYYNELLNKRQFLSREMEPGFLFISKIFASLNIHFTFYFAFWAFLQLFFIYYAFKDERYLLPFIGIVIIMGPQYLSWMNGIRQMLAACIFVYSIHFIKNRKLIPYIITILIAATFHKSAILLLAFYFIPQKDYFKNRYVNIVLLIATLVIGSNPKWLQSIEFVEKTLRLIGYEGYSENLYLMVESRREMAFGPRRLSILALNALTIWYAPKLKQVFKNTNYLIYFNFAFIGGLLQNLFANSSHIFLRPVSYFTIFLALTTAYLLYYLKSKTPNGVSISFLIVLIIALSNTPFSVIADYGKGEMDWSNFKFFWDFV